MIAQSKPREGQPIGHNKFDPKETLKKWNIAVVPYRVKEAARTRDEDLRVIEKKYHHYYYPLAKLALIDAGYKFCIPNKGLNWGVYVRQDLVPKFENCG